MSYKVKVRYCNVNDISHYFWSRSVRTTPNKKIGVNISGKVYPLYKGSTLPLPPPTSIHSYSLGDLKIDLI